MFVLSIICLIITILAAANRMIQCNLLISTASLHPSQFKTTFELPIIRAEDSMTCVNINPLNTVWCFDDVDSMTIKYETELRVSSGGEEDNLWKEREKGQSSRWDNNYKFLLVIVVTGVLMSLLA